MNGIPIELNAQVHRLWPQLHNSANSAAERQYPLVLVSSPLCRQRWLLGDIPAILHVVVDEVLKEQLIHRRPSLMASYGPDVTGQETECPLGRLHEYHSGWANAELTLPKICGIRRGRQYECGSDTPNDLTCLGR